MAGEKELNKLLRGMTPVLNEGEYVFCTVSELHSIDLRMIRGFFKEQEGFTLVLEKSIADGLGLQYTYVGACITLTIHSSLDAIGLTAAFSTALANSGISCNVIAGHFHDHIFVKTTDATKAMKTLQDLSAK